MANRNQPYGIQYVFLQKGVMTGKKSGTNTAGSVVEGIARHLSTFFKEGTLKKLLVFMGIFALILPLMFMGCEGDDGATGAQGPAGPPGPPGTGTLAAPESCSVCHSDVAAIHEATGVATATVTNVDNNASIAVTFTIAVDGVPDDSFTLRRAYVHYDNAALQTTPPTLVTTFVREQLYRVNSVNEGVVITPPSNGVYTITFLDNVVVPDSNYLIQMQSATSTERPVVVVQNGVSQLRDLVSAVGCASCHGPFPAWSENFSHYAVGGSDCQICHSQATRNTAFISRDATGALDNTAPIFGTNLTEYIHGIHNSHNMPDGVYYRTTEPDATAETPDDRYSVGYPSEMRYCAVCHTEPAQLTDVASAPVSYYLCMTCHNNWDGFTHLHDADDGSYDAGDPVFAATDFHRSFTAGDTCAVASCHSGVPTRDEAADFHNDFQSADRHYDSFYRGEDISFSNVNDVAFFITGVSVSADNNVTFTWEARRLGVTVDPCNDNLATNGPPVFTDLGAYLSYAKGDDSVNENIRDIPGQPASARNLFTALTTTCAANVATTTGLTIAPGTEYADKVFLGIGGKPIDRDTFVIGATPTEMDYFVRFPSAIYAFNLADGSPATPRRDAVNNAKCLACHRGTLYQHGGDRVDNEQICALCHNPSASDKNNRKERFQIVNADGTVNTDATYDGQTSETYDMRTMIHGIHGISKRLNPWTVYRGRGIYGFANPDTPLPTGWPGPADNNAVYGSTNGSTMVHNWVVVHYPKPVDDCLACHNAGEYEVPDQAEAVALTVDPGDDYADQSDDIVRGPGAASCTACHNDAPVQTHATDFGYLTNVTKEEMLEKAQ